MRNLKEIVEEKLELETFSKGRKNLVLRLTTIFQEYLSSEGKDFQDITKDDVIAIMSSIKSRSYGSINQHLLAINDILRYIDKEDCKLIVSNRNDIESDVDLHGMVEKHENRYFTREEIIDVCNSFINPQDKFIVYALFCGIHGKTNKDLINLKSKNIDLENNRIILEDKIIIMDDYMKSVCSDMLDPFFGGIYYKYMASGGLGTLSDNYELNFDSEYAIKTKPYVVTNQGLNPIKNEGIRRRLIKLGEVSETLLCSTDLVRSGIMHKMNRIKKDGWLEREVKEFLEQNNVKMRAYELKRIYEMKYNK